MRNARIQRVDGMTTRFSRVTLTLGATDVLGRTPLCCVGLSWVVGGNIPGLYSLPTVALKVAESFRVVALP